MARSEFDVPPKVDQPPFSMKSFRDQSEAIFTSASRLTVALGSSLKRCTQIGVNLSTIAAFTAFSVFCLAVELETQPKSGPENIHMATTPTAIPYKNGVHLPFTALTPCRARRNIPSSPCLTVAPAGEIDTSRVRKKGERDTCVSRS